MKKLSVKKLSVIIILLLCVYFCAPFQSIRMWFESIEVSVLEVDNTKGTISVQITNSSDKRIGYGEYYQLETFADNYWGDINAILEWHDLLYIIESGESRIHNFSLHTSLTPGQYRFTFFFHDYFDRKNGMYGAACEFKIIEMN